MVLNLLLLYVAISSNNIQQIQFTIIYTTQTLCTWIMTTKIWHMWKPSNHVIFGNVA